MMDTWIEFWQAFTTHTLPSFGIWNYLLLAILVALEGPGTTLVGGLVAAGGGLNPFGVFVAAFIGNTAADSGWYFLGRVGSKNNLIERFAWLRRHKKNIEALSEQLQDHATQLILVSKLSFGITMIPTLIAAGMTKVPLSQFLTANLLGELIWTGSLVLVGYYLGAYVSQLQEWLQLLAALGGFVVLAFYFFVIRREPRRG